MKRTFSQSPPEDLLSQLQPGGSYTTFRRCLVLAESNGDWQFAGCTIQALASLDEAPAPRSACRYPRVILHEDLLTAEQCLEFVQALRGGAIQLCGVKAQRTAQAQWRSEFVPLKNDYMSRAGRVITFQTSSGISGLDVGLLLVPNEPYYPNLHEAASDWLPLPGRQTHNDSRHEQITFLLPQIEAYFSDATAPDERTLDLNVGGTLLAKKPLIVKGAYWKDGALHQLETNVANGIARLEVPEDTDRLEYYLLAADGTVYDAQLSDRFSHSGLGKRSYPSSLAVAREVLAACQEGEGTKIDFKSFITPDDRFRRNDQKTQWGRVLTTVVAFANTKGGRIYLGVGDDCSLQGIDHALTEWAKAPIDDGVIQSYLAALSGKIREVVVGDLLLTHSSVRVHGALIALLEIRVASQPPVSIAGDDHLYVRSNSSNRRVPPHQWANILRPSPFHSIGD